MKEAKYFPPFIGAIDQGTSSTRFILFDVHGKIVLSHQEEFEQKYPEPGYVPPLPCLFSFFVLFCVVHCELVLPHHKKFE